MKPSIVPTVALIAPRAQGQGPGGVAPVRSNVGAQIQAAGGAVESTGAAAYRLGEILRARVNRARARESASQLSDAYRDALTGTEGYLHKVGRNAVEGREAVLQRLEDERRRIAEGLDTSEQLDMFGELASGMQQDAVQKVDIHFAQATHAYDLAGAKARAETLGADATDSFFTGGMPSFAAKRDQLLGEDGALDELFGPQGMHPDQKSALKARASDEMHSVVVNRMLKLSETQPGMAIRAGEFLRDAGDRVSPGVREALQGEIRKAGINEQAQEITNALTTEVPGDLLEQLDRVEKLDFPIEVRDEARRRLRQRYSDERTFRANAGSQALDEATTWKSLNPDKALPADQREKLRRLGKESEFDLFVESGNQWRTTTDGFLEALNFPEEDLVQFRSAAEVTNRFRRGLNNARLEDVVLRWRKLRGEALKPPELAQLSASDQEMQFLRRQPTVRALLKDKDKDRLAERLDGFHEAVTLEMRRLQQAGGAKGDATDLRKQALENVWNSGGIVDGNYLPESMWLHAPDKDTPGEAGVAEVEIAPGKTIRTSQFTGQTFDTVGRFSGTTVDLRPLGEASDIRPLWEDAAKAVQYQSVFEALAGRLGRTPSQDEVNRFIATRPPIPAPTPQQIAGYMDKLIAEQEQRKRDANEIARYEHSVRTQATLEALPDLVQDEFGKRLDLAYKRRERWQGLSRLQQEREGFVEAPNHRRISAQSLAAVLERVLPQVAAHGWTEGDLRLWYDEQQGLRTARSPMERLHRGPAAIGPSALDAERIRQLKERYAVTGADK